MDIPGTGNDKTLRLDPEIKLAAKKFFDFSDDKRQMRAFFDFTGGSILYCFSAICVAYGIVNVMGPMLAKGEALKNAMPCIFTLHAYELALLGVLILIVAKKVVDDAISIVILLALFLVGSSIALGSVADTGITASVWLGILGVALAFAKLCLMRKFTKIPFAVLSILGLLIVVACNYFGPISMAHSIAVGQYVESARREKWWLIWIIMLAGAGLVLVEAMKREPGQKESQGDKTPFLQTPVMVCIFALIVLAASGVHQYAIAYTSGLERVIGDYVPITIAGSLIVIEILRLLGKRFVIIEAGLSCLPLAVVMYAIKEKSVLSGSEFGLGLLGYPPAILALAGLAVVCWALYHRRFSMLTVGVLYGLGVILTFGFSPENPHELNFRACLGTLAAILLVYGLIIHNQYLCIASVFAVCIGLSQWAAFTELSKSYQLTPAGGITGAFGLGFAVLFIIFGNKFHKFLRVIGAISLAVFAFDYLPQDIHWRYAIVLVATPLFVAFLWYRAKDFIVASILWAPILIKLYIASRNLAYWRAVILGFLLLAAGTFASLLKRRLRNQTIRQEDDKKVPLENP